MQTLKVNINKTQQPAQILKELRKKNLRKGGTVKLISDKKSTDTNWMSAMMMLGIAFSLFFKKKTERAGEQLLNDLLTDYKSTDELKNHIEKAYGVLIEKEEKNDEEELDFKKLALQNLARAYDIDEPDLSGVTLSEPNPSYQKWKKVK